MAADLIQAEMVCEMFLHKGACLINLGSARREMVLVGLSVPADQQGNQEKKLFLPIKFTGASHDLFMQGEQIAGGGFIPDYTG